MESRCVLMPGPPSPLPWRTRVSNALVPPRNWWHRITGRQRAGIEGRDGAIDAAAMVAHDMGRPDIREAINRLVERGR
jgi:hypothetical protein